MLKSREVVEGSNAKSWEAAESGIARDGVRRMMSKSGAQSAADLVKLSKAEKFFEEICANS